MLCLSISSFTHTHTSSLSISLQLQEHMSTVVGGLCVAAFGAGAAAQSVLIQSLD